jgi:hypothetical protein
LCDTISHLKLEFATMIDDKRQVRADLAHISAQLQHLAVRGWHSDRTLGNEIDRVIKELAAIKAKLLQSDKP